MEARLLGRTSGTICIHVCAISTLSHVLPTLVYGRDPLSAAMAQNTMNTYCCIPIVSGNAEQVLWNELGRYFTLKDESIGPPKIYLG